MRYSWQKIYQDSCTSICTPNFKTQFETMRRLCPTLAAFITAAGLVEHQHSPLVIREEKNNVLHALISIYQQDPGLRDKAGILLFLAMHPALSGTYWKLKFLFGAEEDATGEICLAFYEQITRFKLAKTNRVAANLKMNVFRTVYENRMRLAKDQGRIEAALIYSEAVDTDRPKDECSARSLWEALSGGGDYDPDDVELEAARIVLTRDFDLPADDIELLVLKDLCDRSWGEIGVRLGVKPETARKRHQRLVARLRQCPWLRS
jgi:DNA-directed RNA polymerase specialized sigma24 family protein